MLFLSPASLLRLAGRMPFPGHRAAVRILQNGRGKLARGVKARLMEADDKFS